MDRLIKFSKRAICIALVFLFILSGCTNDPTDDGSKVISTGQFALMVLNTRGEVLSDVTVSFNGEEQKTESDGCAIFTLPEEKHVKISAKCSDYYDYYNDDFYIDALTGTITMKPRTLASHHLDHAYYRNAGFKIDLLQDCKKVNLSTPNMTFDINAGVIDDSDTVSEYRIIQKNATDEKIISISSDGNFNNLKVGDFSEGTNIYIEVIDSKGRKVSTSINLEVGENPSYNEFSELSFGDSLSFDVADDIPIFGGTTFNLDLPSMPIDYKISGDCLRVGFNVDKGTFDNESEMDDYKKLMNSINHASYAKENYRKLVNQLKKRQKKKGIFNMSGFDSNVEVTASGYIETGFDNSGQLSTGTGYLCVSISADASFDWQVIVWCVPITIEVTGEISADLSSTVQYNVNENKFTGDVSLSITPGLELKAGVGFKYLSAGLYGGVELDTKIIIASLNGEKKPGCESIDLNGDFGVYGKAAFLEAKHEFLSGTINLYQRNNKGYVYSSGSSPQSSNSNNDNSFDKDSVCDYLYDVGQYSPVSKSDNATMTVSTGSYYDVLSDGINPGSTPVTVSDGETGFTAFTTQEKMDNAENSYSKIYYSFYKDGYWSDCVALDDSTSYNNEMNPKLFSYDGNYYLAYQDGVFDYSLYDNYNELSEQEKRELLRKSFNMIDIHIKKFDMQSETFVDLGCIKTTDSYDYNYSMVVNSGVPYVYFASNAEGDFFGTSRQGCNTIYKAYLSNGQWAISKTASNLNSVTQLQAGLFKNTVSCLYSVDSDNDLTTKDDVKLYLHNGSNKYLKNSFVTCVLFDAVPSTNNKVFMFADDNGLYYIENDMKIVTLFDESNNYTGEYAISQKGIYYVAKKNSCTEIYVRYPQLGGGFTNPVQMTEEGKWQKDVSSVTLDEKDLITALSEEFDSYEEKYHTQLVSYKFEEGYNISIDEVYVNPDDIFSKDEVPITMTITNKGNKFIDGEKITITDENDNYLDVVEDNYSVSLQPGESKTVNLTVVTNKDTVYGSWCVQGEINSYTSEDIWENDYNNNKFILKTGFSDFSVSTKLCNSGAYPYIIAEVENLGNVSDSTNLRIYNANDTTEQYNSYSTESIQPNEAQVFKIRLKDDWVDDNGRIAILLDLDKTNDEIYTYNNFLYEYASLNHGKFIIKYNLNGGKNNSKNQSIYTTADSITFASPTRNGYTFKGWFTTPNFEEASRITEIVPGSAGDMILYAKWERPKTSVTLKSSKGQLYLKGSLILKPVVKNGMGSTSYKTSNKRVAIVDRKGKITALRVGTAKITVTNNKVSKVFTVKVIRPKLNRTSINLKKKKGFTLKVIGRVGKVKFATSNKKIVTVNSKGKIVARKKGKATITVKTNGITLKCKVKVK